MGKSTVLLDVDNTILDADSVKGEVSLKIDANYGEGSSEEFWRIYKEVVMEVGFADIAKIAERFAQRRNSGDFASAMAAFMEVDFKKHLIPGANELVDFLAKNSRLVIFTKGHEVFQRQKVNKLGLSKIADEVIISASKKDLFLRIKQDFKPPFVVIDDKVDVLLTAKKALGDVTTIWMKFGSRVEENGTEVDFKADNLSAIISYLREIISSR